MTPVEGADAPRLGIKHPQAGNWHLHPAVTRPEVNALARIFDDLPLTSSDRSYIFLRDNQPTTPGHRVDEVKRRCAVVTGEHVAPAIRRHLVRFHRNPGSDRPVVAREICISANGKAGRVAGENSTRKVDPATLRLTCDGRGDDRELDVKA